MGCRSYVHSEPPRRKGLKISGLLVSRPTAVELMPPQRPRLPIGATLCSARRPSLSIFLAAASSPAATTTGDVHLGLAQATLLLPCGSKGKVKAAFTAAGAKEATSFGAKAVEVAGC